MGGRDEMGELLEDRSDPTLMVSRPGTLEEEACDIETEVEPGE